MKRIIKIGPLQIGSLFALENYERIVHFDEQDNQLFLWLEENMEHDVNNNAVHLIVGTGREYEPTFHHVKSVVTTDGYVWHLLKERDWISSPKVI